MTAGRRTPRHRPLVVAVALVATFLVALGGAGVGPASATSGKATALTFYSGNGPCTTSHLSTSFSGNLSVEGGPLTESAAVGMNLTVSYDEQVTVAYDPNGTLISENCLRVSETVTTGAAGAFSGSASPPPESCAPASGGGLECTDYASPFGPLTIVPTTLPSGYLNSAVENGSTFALAWVAGLASVTVLPSGPSVGLAPGATTSFVATPWTANGTRSPLSVTFVWGLNGSGFDLTPSNGSAAVVASGPDATATLNVSASATAGTNTFRAPTVTLDLASIATTLTAGSIARTTFDAQEPVAVEVSAVGPSGYAYSARLRLAPGLPDTNISCASSSTSPTEVAVRCSTSISYPSAGTAVLSVNVSNGFSSAVWTSPILTIDPPPALQLDPAQPVGYVGAAVPLTLSAANGSGVLPYARACFAPGAAPMVCSATAGPSWTFDPVYAATGNFSGDAWVIDAAGMNRSVAAAVQVVDPLSVSGLSAAALPLAAGVPTNLSVLVAGGALPAEVWWNATDRNGPIVSGSVTGDGRITVPFAPPVAGTVEISVTVRDALGSARSENLSLAVDPGPAAALETVVGPSPAPETVGHPVPLAWRALDAVGEVVPTFAAPVDLVIQQGNGSSAPSWLNLSGLGALSPTPIGAFAIPSSAWSAGVLFVNLTPAVAGDLTVRLEGSAAPGGGTSVDVSVSPDLTHLRLYDPVIALAGTGVNRTYWHVSDRFGDPVPGAYLYFQYNGGGSASASIVPITWDGPNATGAWVNYSLRGVTVGTVEILDGAGAVLVGPVSLAPTVVSVAPVAGPPLAVLALSVAVMLGLAAALGTRPRRRERVPLPPTEEEAARRLAEGRAETLEVVRRLQVADRAAIAQAWEAPSPPAELAEWLAALVADGTLVAAPGPEGREEYALAPTPPYEPRVTVDAEMLDRAVAARAAAVEERPEE